MSFWNNLIGAITDSFDPIGLFHTGSSGVTGSSTSLSNLWDHFKNGNANDINYQIAQDNLNYQKERNAIEDARYEEETAYNRAWQEDERAYQRAFAEDEREYNRALQQTLFDREDTAYLRQAEQLSKLGINPLSQQLNGAGAGSVVSSSAPNSAAEPTSSARGGSALHNDFTMQPGGLASALSALSGIAQTVNGVATGQYQRDSLALQNDAQLLNNMVTAKKYGFDWYSPSTKKNQYDTYNGFDSEYFESLKSTADYDDINKKREYDSKKKHNIFDWETDTTKTIKSLGNLDFQNLAENLLTNVGKAGNWVTGNIKDAGKDLENSAIMNFIKLFFAL